MLRKTSIFRLHPTTTTRRVGGGTITSSVLAVTSRTLRGYSHPQKALLRNNTSNSALCNNTVIIRHHHHRHKRWTFTTTNTTTTAAASSTIARQSLAQSPKLPPIRTIREIWKELRQSPLQYATIPAVAACMAMYTNWIAVKMLFYPIEYVGTEWYREPFVPYGVSVTMITICYTLC